ncbi:dynein light chain type 1 [Opisthorchis viverrini]|uniref:Dynein light chain n=1 Tax=Opisthorchis viverrini TaxID=6198 RepID=A0A1S8X931_OPIVI|nr:dynein light chain type 1 [Opisthorchis viverrini]
MTVVGTDKKAVVKYTDMNEQKQQTAVDCCAAVMERFSDTQDIAKYIKHEFDRRFGGVWQCVVGKFFGW